MVQILAASLGCQVSSREPDGAAGYTPFHPRWYRARVSTYWWLKRRSYFVFILRELSSLFVPKMLITTIL